MARLTRAISAQSLTTSSPTGMDDTTLSAGSLLSRLIRFRNVDWLMPSSSPTSARALSCEIPSSSVMRSRYFRTARCWASMSDFFGAGMTHSSGLDHASRRPRTIHDATLCYSSGTPMIQCYSRNVHPEEVIRCGRLVPTNGA